MSLSFDATFYQSARPDVYNAFIATQGSTGLTWAQFAETHFNTFGWVEGSDPSASFDTSFYLTAYPDVAAAGMNPFTHFLQFGSLENRQPFGSFPNEGNGFDPAAYAAANSDLATAGITTDAALYQHFAVYGQFESRPGAPTVTTPTQPGETFTLTAGVDFASTSNAFINGAIPSTFRFSDASETVEALAGGMNATDVLLDGSVADSDVLNLRGFNGAADALGTVTNIENINFITPGAAAINQTLASVTGAKSLSVAGSTANVTFTNAGGTGITTYDFSGVTAAASAVSLAFGTTTPTDALTITGGAGGDTLAGGNGADTIVGGGGADTITGAAGNDVITGGAGNDALTGGAGDDTFNVDVGTDTINDLTTGDVVVISSGATLATAAGSIGAFVATSATTNEGTAATLNASAGGATIDVSAASGSKGFTIVGGAGKDTLTGGANADTITNAAGGGTVTGGGGKDAITLGAGTDVLVVNAGDTGVTTATADTVATFTSATDTIKTGLAGTATNFQDANTGAVATVEAAVTAANAAFNGTIRYFFDDDGANGFLVADSDGDGTADWAVSLTGVAALVATDIVA
jgi:S-layer protein